MAEEWTPKITHAKTGITITKNCKRTAGDTEANVVLEFNLVTAALDHENIIHNKAPRNTITKLKIIGRVHSFTTDPESGEEVNQPSHLTVKVFPGGNVGHLWLLPANGTTITKETTLDLNTPFSI